jgi:UPF0271 protein
MNVDLNSDLGEGAGQDDAILRLVTSANISCGAHAGTDDDLRAALRGAKENGVVVGAHPGYADRENFGRRELDLADEAIYALCVEQVEHLRSIANEVGVAIRYLKPHGALYNQACRDERVAGPIARAAETLKLPLLALPGSKLEAASCSGFYREGFADRRYQADSSLVPRSRPDAFVTDPDEAVTQAIGLIEHGVQSLCVHGDNPEAVAFVRKLREAMRSRGLEVRAFR